MSYYKIRLIPCCICEADHNKRTQLSSAAWSPPGDDAAGLEAATALAAVTFMVPPVCHASSLLPLPTARRPENVGSFPPGGAGRVDGDDVGVGGQVVVAIDPVARGGVGCSLQPGPHRRRRPADAVGLVAAQSGDPGGPVGGGPRAPARPGSSQRASE